MSEAVEGLVETSTNLAIVDHDGERLRIQYSTRSAVDSLRDDLRDKIGTIGQKCGATATQVDPYPGWAPQPDSEIIALTKQAYAAVGQELKTSAIHAGLECGVIMKKYHHLQAISIGPTILGAHTTSEQLHVPSAERFYWIIEALLGQVSIGRLDEEEEDRRHVRQFRLTEEEFDCTTLGMTRDHYDENFMYESLLRNIQNTVQSMIRRILADNEDILREIYHRDTARLRKAIKSDFLRITYDEAIKLLQENGYPKIKFGDDLSSKHEAKIVELLNSQGSEIPVFIMKYPKEIKFFNMKVAGDDDRVCLSADLILPYAGEGTGSSVREHDYERLQQRLISSTMYKLHLKRGGKYEDFGWYLDIMERKATNPHAGYGIGNDRVLQYIFAETDIRNTSIFSLLNQQTGDWQVKN